MSARRFEPGHLETDAGQFTVGREHHLGGVDHPPPRRRRAAISLGRRTIRQLHPHRLTGEPLGLEVSLHREAIPRVDPRGGEEIGDADIRRQPVRPRPDGKHRNPRLRERRGRRRRIDAGVVASIGEEDHPRERARRFLIDDAHQRLADPRLESARLESLRPIRLRRTVGPRALLRAAGEDGERFGIGVETPHRDLVRRGEGGEHSSPFEDLYGPRRTGRGNGIRYGHAGVEPLRQGHAGAGVDDDGHPRRKHHFVLGDPLEIEIGRSEGGQCPEPQPEEEQTDPPRQFGRIAPIHPRHPRRHGDEHRDQQRHLPPLRETLQQRAGNAVLHHVGGG